jgi:ketosteroid isomerase-like protein
MFRIFCGDLTGGQAKRRGDAAHDLCGRDDRLHIEVQELKMDDPIARTALQRHWDASDAGDFEAEHEIYREDAVLDYPQSGERIRGRDTIRESRYLQPSKKRFAVRRIVGSGDFWVTELTLSYDGAPSYVVSVMEFRDGLVAHETQYFAERFEPGPSRAHLVEAMG